MTKAPQQAGTMSHLEQTRQEPSPYITEIRLFKYTENFLQNIQKISSKN